MHDSGDVCGRGACVAWGCVAGEGGGGCMTEAGMWGRGAWQGGACAAGEMAIAAGSTHPTGMHSCYHLKYDTTCLLKKWQIDIERSCVFFNTY